ncbi:hypothetical protein CRUP_022085 [Coryphaenoides rupestris]|nr:hypothetical protein CRUP_022085 [Coryphaenoides rupestris]
MQMLYTSTLAVSSEKNPTVGQILPILGKLKDNFEAAEDSDTVFIRTIKEKIWGDISIRYQDENIRRFLEEATAIDPRFKTKVQGNRVWTRLQEAAMDKAAGEISLKRPKLSALEKLFAEEDRALLQAPTEDVHSSRETTQKEVDFYRSLPAALSSVNPATWWWDKRDSLPVLSQLSPKYLCVQASSTPSERVFSTAGDTISQE